MRGRLNVFQRTVLLWNEMHPYNAVHVVKIKQPFNPGKLKNIIDCLLEKHGLVNLVIDPGRKRYDYEGGRSDVRISVVKCSDPSSCLCQEVQKHLNTPFAISGSINPFRFFIIPDDGGFLFGLVYFHLIAGADSVIMLLKHIVSSYAGRETAELSAETDIYPERYFRLMPFSLRRITAWILTFPERIAHMRKSSRPGYRDHDDFSSGFSCFSIGPSQYHAIIRTAGSWGVTVNDLFLAALLKSVAPFASKRLRAERRSHISAASIVNIRGDLSAGDDVFGVFLSYFNVTHPVPEGIKLEQLAKDVHLQTEKIKKHKVFLRTVIEMWAARILVDRIFRKRRKYFYAKYNPVWGGITNVNLNRIWFSTSVEIPEYYLRAVSTGPATPLVFSFTTANDTINVGVSYRYAVFGERDVERIISDFPESLAEITCRGETVCSRLGIAY